MLGGPPGDGGAKAKPGFVEKRDLQNAEFAWRAGPAGARPPEDGRRVPRRRPWEPGRRCRGAAPPGQRGHRRLPAATGGPCPWAKTELLSPARRDRWAASCL